MTCAEGQKLSGSREGSPRPGRTGNPMSMSWPRSAAGGRGPSGSRLIFSGRGEISGHHQRGNFVCDFLIERALDPCVDPSVPPRDPELTGAGRPDRHACRRPLGTVPIFRCGRRPHLQRSLSKRRATFSPNRTGSPTSGRKSHPCARSLWPRSAGAIFRYRLAVSARFQPPWSSRAAQSLV